MLHIALYEPDIPQNTGTLMRLGACMNVGIHVIEPCGFPFSIKALRRSAMDYADHVDLYHHDDFADFCNWVDENHKRLVLLTTKGASPLPDFSFTQDDILLLGRESAGVPDTVHSRASERLYVPMAPGMRSLNVALAGAMVIGEALRQTKGYSV
ncbi:tRNA (cytidine(34)-2'-O)-methyltransferase [Temperatibacter marinus]|uniref:tRNA (cytidine(34)-2'-O)-methyltransferase n=1 Tax=Temperatibacter marinus TaxID=1456591 RepID=A0AA52EFJ9_9PROT|nr:tRNA (cytidine(34)-2'-O)-methyltransferase [Temperatibacter marinus]WND01609.1 tRNA (cytidine(34)-2'-O)-methyltransferase [Temperatibacter marinus]